MRKLMLIFTLLCVTVLTLTAASSSDSTAFTHSLSLDVRSGFVTQHHDLFRGVNATGTPIKASASAHIQYAFRFPSASRLGRIMP